MSTLEQRAADWMDQANCIGADPDLFYINRGETGFTGKDTSAAKNYCYQCPVRRQCLDYALDHREIHGIWGGTTPRERRGLRQQRRTMT